MRWLVPRPARLAERVRPYTSTTRTGYAKGAGLSQTGSVWVRIARMLLSPLASRLGRWLDRDEGASTKLRLRQTGLYHPLDDDQALEAYRFRQMAAMAMMLVASLGVAFSLRLSGPRAIALSALGLLIGVTRNRGQIDRAIRNRQELMRIEIYTVNQLLAMRVRAGGGVIHAVQQVVERGRGEVVGELAEALRMHRAGVKAADSFSRLASLTPEPSCARTYSLLAAAEERGADLGKALLELSEDVREARREAMRRSATRRRAAMLVPIIGILAPVMLLFVGAPLPQVIFGWQ
ncbi:MAG TPA: type II secretion system F family protein [Acidimicrobiia bacterium]|nr:type II secretion system F family protein [Acidimicrobiia bacterium]